MCPLLWWNSNSVSFTRDLLQQTCENRWGLETVISKLHVKWTQVTLDLAQHPLPLSTTSELHSWLGNWTLLSPVWIQHPLHWTIPAPSFDTYLFFQFYYTDTYISFLTDRLSLQKKNHAGIPSSCSPDYLAKAKRDNSVSQDVDDLLRHHNSICSKSLWFKTKNLS